MSTGRVYQVEKVGVFTPKRFDKPALSSGEVGFVIAGIKEVNGAPVGDTLTLENRRAETPLPGFQEVRPRVFSGLYPVSSDDYDAFRDALQKLKLNDSALHYEPETSQALGFGFRLRISRNAAYGDCAGAARARVQPGSDHYRANRHLRGRAKRQ